MRPIYDAIGREVFGGSYVHLDETPIRYLAPGRGQTRTGYLWRANQPGGDVFYQLQPSRGGDCLRERVPEAFAGVAQSDGYGVYAGFAEQRRLDPRGLVGARPARFFPVQGGVAASGGDHPQADREVVCERGGAARGAGRLGGAAATTACAEPAAAQPALLAAEEGEVVGAHPATQRTGQDDRLRAGVVACAADVIGARRGGDRQQRVRAQDPADGGREKELAVHWACRGGPAQRDRVHGHRELPDTWERSVELPEGCAHASPCGDQLADPGADARGLSKASPFAAPGSVIQPRLHSQSLLRQEGATRDVYRF